MAAQSAGSGRWVHDTLRRWLSNAARDLAIVGASFYGSADLLIAIRENPPGRAARSTEPLRREIAEGIAEIEAFLAARAPRPNPTPRGGHSPERTDPRVAGSDVGSTDPAHRARRSPPEAT
jgi:hypothetical protein